MAVIATLVGADLAARRATEVQLERRVRIAVSSAENVPVDNVPVENVKVHIDSFPFLGRLGVSGSVSGVRAKATGVVAGRLRFSSITVNLREVHIDRDRLVLDRQVDIKSAGRGDAVGEISQADLRRALDGVPVVLGDGKIGVTVAGVTASVSARVTDGVLRLSAGGVSFPAVTLPKVPLLPCATGAVSAPGRLFVSCAAAQVPPELLRPGASLPGRRVPSVPPA